MRRSTTTPVAVLAAAVLLLAACGDGDPAAPDDGTDPAVTTTASAAEVAADISVEGFAFVPARVTITLGETVRWTNMDAVGHTTTSDDGSWNDSLSQPFEFTPTEAGTFEYFCAIHPEMRGTLIVEG
jgi:plastocyanin